MTIEAAFLTSLCQTTSLLDADNLATAVSTLDGDSLVKLVRLTKMLQSTVTVTVKERSIELGREVEQLLSQPSSTITDQQLVELIGFANDCLRRGWAAVHCRAEQEPELRSTLVAAVWDRLRGYVPVFTKLAADNKKRTKTATKPTINLDDVGEIDLEG